MPRNTSREDDPCQSRLSGAREQKEGAANLGVKNEHQCIDFILREGEKWNTFAGSNLKKEQN
jgi:hypothetical protein